MSSLTDRSRSVAGGRRRGRILSGHGPRGRSEQFHASPMPPGSVRSVFPPASAANSRGALEERATARRLLRPSTSSGSGLAREADGRECDPVIRPRISRFFAILLVALGHAAVAAAQTGTGSWVSIGPDGIGAILSLAIDPTATATLYAGTDGAGGYKSTDGAATGVSSSAGLTALRCTAAAHPAIFP